MPITQIAVITTISATAPIMITALLSARSSSPSVSSPKRTPTSASAPITSTPVIVIAQPPCQPHQGPIARVTHEKVVPQSWSTRLR